jgi:hypothetical protein
MAVAALRDEHAQFLQKLKAEMQTFGLQEV